MIKKRIIQKYLIALVCLLLIGCAGNKPIVPVDLLAESTTPVEEVGTLEEYYLQPGDSFEIVFYNNPELDREVTIRPDGKLSIPPLEEFLVAGLTPDQLDKTLTQKYKAELKNPVLNVILTGFEGQRIYVGGEVNVPMVYYLTGKTNVIQAIFEAGGITADAAASSVVVVSKSVKGQPIARIVDLKRAIAGKLSQSEYLLKPFDMVYVPKTQLAKSAHFMSRLYEFFPPNVGLGFSYVLKSDE